MNDLFWLTDEQMARLQPYFPKSHGRKRIDDRRVLSGIIFVNRNGLRWRDAPREYGPAKTLYNRWKRWSDKGIFVRMMEGLAAPQAIHEFEASARAEFSSFEGRKFRGMVNIPVVDDLLAVRVAASSFDRNGYVTNVLNDRKIDGRSLYSFRATVGLTPSDRIDAYFTWQRFRENDDRLLTGKAVCVADNGPILLKKSVMVSAFGCPSFG